MARHSKYNLKQELLKENERVLNNNDGVDRRMSLLGISALSKPDYNNSMRTNMFTSHTRQFITLVNSQFPKVYFGAENTVGRHSTGYCKTTDDKKVYKKIVKHGEIIDESDIVDDPYVYMLFLYDEIQDEYSVVYRNPCEDLTEIFGYDYNNAVIDSYDEGDIIPKGTVLYKSTSYDDNMNYCYGQNAKVMYTLDPSTFEDAGSMSDEFANNFIGPEVETIEVSLNDNDYLLNIFGKDVAHYRTLPKIGEYVNGILCASRRQFNNQLLYDFRNSNLSRIIDGDSVYYVKGKVLDINVYCNNSSLTDNVFNRDVLKYLNSQTEYWKDIFDTTEYIMNQSGSNFTREIRYLNKRAKEMLDMKESKWKEGDSDFSNLYLQILIERHPGCQAGQKFTARYGNKSVVSKIIPKEKMPYYYDDEGNKVYADMMINLLAIVNRTTAYPLYELGLTFIQDKFTRHLKKDVDSFEQKEKEYFELLYDFNPEYYDEMRRKYMRLSDEDKRDWINSVQNGEKGKYTNGLFFKDVPFHETTPIFYRMRNIYNKYKSSWLKSDRLYINKWGREIPVLNEHRISEMYIMKLKQTSTKGFSARNSGSINSKGLPERSYKSRAHLERYSSSPIRFGEYESLNFTIGTPTDEFALFHALYRTSIKGRQDVAKNAMDISKETAEISDTYDSRTAEIFSVILLSLGLGLDFIDDDDVLTSYDENSLEAVTIKDKTFICSPYDAVMLERIGSIEDDIMKDNPIMDRGILIDSVREKMLIPSYVSGTSDPDDIEHYLNMYYNS